MPYEDGGAIRTSTSKWKSVSEPKALDRLWDAKGRVEAFWPDLRRAAQSWPVLVGFLLRPGFQRLGVAASPSASFDGCDPRLRVLPNVVFTMDLVGPELSVADRVGAPSAWEGDAGAR